MVTNKQIDDDVDQGMYVESGLCYQCVQAQTRHAIDRLNLNETLLSMGVGLKRNLRLQETLL